MFIPFLTQNENISFLEGLSVTATCVLIVFAMLIILALAVALFQFIKGGDNKVEEVAAPVVSAPQPKPSLKLEDIKDDDMMAAALVATIDYYEETKQDVRVVSIKQIG